MFVSPNIERRRRNLIDQWNGKPESRQVHTFNVVLAGVTGFDPDMVVFGRVKITEFRWPLFTTICAGDASERPVNRTCCANQIPVATL